MSVDLGNAARRNRTMTAHARKKAGIGAAEFPAGAGAVHVSILLPAARTGFRCVARDAEGARLAQAPMLGGERQVGRLQLPEGPARTVDIFVEDQDGATPELLDIIVEARRLDDPFALPYWTPANARWDGDALELTQTGDALRGPLLDSKDAFTLEMCFEAVAGSSFVVGLVLRDIRSQAAVAERYWQAEGASRGVAVFRNVPPGAYSPTLVAFNLRTGERPVLRALDVHVRAEPSRPLAADKQNTYLAHWNVLQRWVHDRCKRSRDFNAFVQGVEMRLGREEILSVPRYMSFCPTGQCNALCDFCAVTINRTGIIKKQIDGDLIERFTKPVRRTVHMYGLEGNGEPTLHRGFPGLVEDLTSSGSEAYLITNGSRFSESLLPSIMRLESVNVSLNAATGQTHRAVMKLKEHAIVMSGLRRIVRARGFQDADFKQAANPRVSASFVVTRQNAHEVEQFLIAAEDDLGLDVVLIRPLSELGNDELGAVEDLRDIVPYESDIEDLIDAIENYKAYSQQRLEIRFEQGNYKSVRPDPLGYMPRPPGFENRLLAPRQNHWTTSSTELALTWRRSTARLKGAVSGGNAWEAVSAPIPVQKDETLQFRADAAVRLGAVEFIIEGETPDDVVWRRELGAGETSPLVAVVAVGDRASLRIRLRVADEADADIGFERLRTPSAPTENGENALRQSRWEVGSAGVEAAITPQRARVRFEGPANTYLIKSYAVPTQQGSKLRIRLNADVTNGKLGAGLLSADQSRWLATGEVKDGSVTLEAMTGQDDSFRVAFYAGGDGLVEAAIDMSDASVVCDEVGESEAASPMALSTPLPAEDPTQATAEAPTRSTVPPRLIAVDEPGNRQRKYFCHKPWTDLHNFTVDGRMDVCCIATGPSQERYALGNLKSQNFQDVWNGATVKLFRRTVNSDKVLPPCARCPMGYQYHGMWFNREHTIGRIAGWVWQSKLMRHPSMNRVTCWVINVLTDVTKNVAFRKFK